MLSGLVFFYLLSIKLLVATSNLMALQLWLLVVNKYYIGTAKLAFEEELPELEGTWPEVIACACATGSRAWPEVAWLPDVTLSNVTWPQRGSLGRPNEKNKELYQLFKNNSVGGPNIVFHRYHERDVTTNRPRDYEEPKACKKIIGYDANALYLWNESVPERHSQYVMSGWRLNGWNGKPSRTDSMFVTRSVVI